MARAAAALALQAYPPQERHRAFPLLEDPVRQVRVAALEAMAGIRVSALDPGQRLERDDLVAAVVLGLVHGRIGIAEILRGVRQVRSEQSLRRAGDQTFPQHPDPACDSADINPLGQGTEQLEDYLLTRFPDVPLVRIDRDATARKGSLERLLAQLSEPGPALLVGTQMLAKGHHFPGVTLVGVVDADGGLYSADFRATERLAQLLVQVAGRAGRGTKPGQVLIQTRFPDHPLLRTLVRDGYRAFATAALTEREAAQLPPFSHQALLRADAREMDQAQAFLEQAAGVVQRHLRSELGGVEVWGPVPAPMARRGGRQRAQLLFQAAQRDRLHHALHVFADQVHTLPNEKRVRWSLDVDPVDLF